MGWLKIAEIPEYINTKDLEISFDNTFYDYVIRAPWDPEQYVTYIAGFRLGFGPRYLLSQLLKKVERIYPNTIPTHIIQTNPIPKLEKPIVRRLGNWLKKKYKNGPIEEKVRQERKKWLQFQPHPELWEVTTGTERSYKNINRPEERWWY